MDTDSGGGASRSTDPAAGTSSATDVSLREFEDEKIKAVRVGIAALFVFGAFAWSEIQRRLEILNHENARLLQQQEKTVSQDTYTANESQRKQEQIDLNIWRKEVDRDRTQSISRDEFQRDNREEKQSGFDNSAKLAALAIAATVIVVNVLLYYAGNH